MKENEDLLDKSREVLFELTGLTKVVKKVKVRFDEKIELPIFENPSQELETLVINEFLRKKDNYGRRIPYQTETVKILKDEDCDSFEQEDDELIYMSKEDEDGFSLPQLSLGSCSHLNKYKIKSVLSFGNITTDDYIETTPNEPFFRCTQFDSDLLTKEKEEIIEMWNNKDFKSIKNYTFNGTPKFKMYQNLFEKELPNKEQQNQGGVFLLLITDFDSYRTNNCSKDSTVLGKKRIK